MMGGTDGLIGTAKRALAAATDHVDEVAASVRRLCGGDGHVDAASLDRHQIEAHGYAWMEAYVAILGATHKWAEQLEAAGDFGRMPALLLEMGFGEYLAQLGSGIAMSQDEVFRPAQYGLVADGNAFSTSPDVQHLITAVPRARTQLIELLRQSGPDALMALGDGDDETARMIRGQFRTFADERVAPQAPGWHDRNELIPLDLVKELAALGVFGLTTAEEFGGSGLGAEAMCVVTEELSRGYIGVGSLGTRSEIASELIRLGGTDEQKRRWLPLLASGEVLPTAVFTEPNTGSDLANLSTRAERSGDTYRIFGNKTWITHAARADLMVLLARTGGPGSGHRGLTMFLAEKPRATAEADFLRPACRAVRSTCWATVACVSMNWVLTASRCRRPTYWAASRARASDS